jgi:hypothetical protein
MVAPHSESLDDNDDDNEQFGGEDEIERMGEAEAEKDPEVLATLIEQSHLRELSRSTA